MDACSVYAPHLARMAIVHTIAHAQRPGDDEVTGRDTDTGAPDRRIDNAHGQLGFDVNAQAADGILDADQGLVVGDTQAVDVTNFRATLFQALFNLGSGAVHQHQAQPERVEQGDIVDQFVKAVAERLAAEGNDDRRAAVRLDVGGRLANVGHEGMLVFVLFIGHKP